MPPAFIFCLAAGVFTFAVIAISALLVRMGRRGLSRAKWETLTSLPQLPPDVATEISPWLARLARFGFRPSIIQRSATASIAEGYRWLLVNEAEESFATLDRVIVAGGGHPRVELTFLTAEPSGILHVTSDRQGVIHHPSYWHLIQQRFRKVEDQWRMHWESLPWLEKRCLPPVERLSDLLTADEAARFQSLLETGSYEEKTEFELRPTWRYLPRWIAQNAVLVFRGGRNSRLSRRDVALSSAIPETPPVAFSIDEAVELDLSRFRKLSKTRRPGDFLRRWAIVGTTVAALTFFFGHGQPLQTVITALILCAVHELGHWLAMRFLGFRGLFPMFIPFSGDIDRGRKLHAPAWQHLVVLLAGPLPGLLFGLVVFSRALLQQDVAPWLLDAGGLALVLNGIHLLPFLPLDGGKVADLLFFRDLPWLRPLFTLSSGVAALTGAIALKSRLMRQIALTMFGGLIWDLRTIAVVRGARKIAWAGELSDEDEALRRAFRCVREEGNSGFVGSYGWHHKVEAMLAEVLRRRPGFGIRAFGGAVYAVACLAPLLAVGSLLVLPLLPRNQSRQEVDFAAEFKELFPVEIDAAVDPSAVAELGHLSQVMLSKTAGGAMVDLSRGELRKSLAGKMLPTLAEPLDRLNWQDAGIMLRRGELDSSTVSIWLEMVSSQMESACTGGRDEEAVRRAEVVLHAVSKLEPVPTLGDRLRVQDAEERALAVIEQQSALGQIELKRLRGISDRINLLNREPQPEVDNYLLVRAWTYQRQAETLKQLAARKPLEICFWRDISERAADIRQYIADSGRQLTPAPVAVARLWQKTRRVGELPPVMGEPVSVTAGASALTFNFCERQRELTWRRITALSAIRLEISRRQNGKFPQMVRYNVPGGASLELVRDGGPWLSLVDFRDANERQPPAWMVPEHGRPVPPTKPLDHRCPLFGAPRILDISMQ